jgi:DNA-binding transcriptional MerR regulator
MPIRLEQLAAELGITMADLNKVLRTLRRHSSSLRPQFITEDLADRVRTQLPQLQQRWEKQELARQTRAATQVTAREAAAELNISADRIRQWVARGHLRPAGRQGRENLFTIGDVEKARGEVRDRTHRSPHPRHMASENLDRLVTTEAAAKIANVTPSTIRGWVSRGHLPAAGRRQRQLVFTIRDVIAAANR